MASKGPVFVGGCPRSGTTLVTSVLRDLGLDPGVPEGEIKPLEEPEFSAACEWMLRTLNGRTWDNPVQVNPSIRTTARLSLIKRRNAVRKDPRLAATWRAWLEAFPNGRVILMIRHPLDVAASLVRRERAKPIDLVDCAPIEQEAPGGPDEVTLTPWPIVSQACLSYHGAFRVWQKYERLIHSALSIHDYDDRLLILRFEDLIEQPDEIVGQIADHAGLDLGDYRLAPNRLRRYAWRRDPKLVAMWEEVKDEVPRWGYRNVSAEDDTPKRDLVWWRGLPENAQDTAVEMFTISEFKAEGHRIRSAQVDSGAQVLDPVAADEYPATFNLVSTAGCAPGLHRHRVRQVLANIDRGMGWGIERGQLQDVPAYIVGNGPSAELAREMLPTRAEGRAGAVFAINGAAEMFPGDHDFWACSCALWPDGDEEWLDRHLSNWSAFDHTGADGIFQVYTSARAVDQFRTQGGVDAHFYVGLQKNPYRNLLDNHHGLPSFQEGIQGVVSVIHAAYWLGCAPIVLFGIDQCRPLEWSGSDRIHSQEGAGWRPSGIQETQWYRREGLVGPVETCDQFLIAGQHVSAIAMWLSDTGWPIVNASRGLDFGFAPAVDPYDYLREIEPNVRAVAKPA